MASHLFGVMKMFYYTIYESEAAARVAAASIAASTRADHKVRETEAHQVSTGMIAPIDRPLVRDAEAVYGFTIHKEGPFARADEPDRGMVRRTHGFAWVVY